MTGSGVAIGMVSTGAVAVGVAAVLVPPTRRLAPRVRPYTVASRLRLGHRADVAMTTRSKEALSARTVIDLFGAPLQVFVTRLGRIVERRTDDALQLALQQSGFVDVTPSQYRNRVALQVGLFGGTGAVFGALLLRSAIATLGLMACGVVVGASRSRGRIERAVGARRERIRLELYTVNQLLAIHVRTGAGTIRATQRIVDRGAGAVVEELEGILRAVRSGVSEPDAFRRAAEVTPEPAAARTYKLLAAAAERGVDLADGLRALSEDLRDSRREELRKTATKRRAAMLIPTIAVLAPVMLLFIAAPLPSIVFGSR
ncbi:MAG TPA: type II secretion system F family protein [Acidimicrobiia bacterium]